ncbi:MAG: TolC family protein [Bacteroidetes bacterium]|nr:TolC family protein [Bacteroidota bacterium]
MNIFRQIFAVAIVILINTILPASSTSAPRILTLNDVLQIALDKSPDAQMARHRFRGSYWQYRSYRAGYLPHLRFDGTVPNLNRSISPITLPDGSDVFIRRSLATSSGSLSISQTIGLTGGQLFISSGLQRIDLIRDDKTEVSYLTTPINVGFRQPLFSYNPYKWERKIEPIRYEEAKRQYIDDLESISITATNMFFDLLLAQMNIEINRLNLSSNDTLYQIAKGRFSLGRIAENELLQMELNLLNSESLFEQSLIDYEAALFNFRSYLGIDGNSNIELFPPKELHSLKIAVEKAMEEAKKNRPDMLAQQRYLIEAESQISRAKADSRVNANLFGVVGYTQSADNFDAAYKNPLDQQQVSIGISIPIIDWGVGRGKIKMAESNLELMQTRVNQAMNDFEQEIFLRVMEFNMLESQLNIAQKADVIAEKRYDVTLQRFLIGKIDIIELNLAIEEKDRSKQRYLAALRSYWRSFYEMRRLTHYDFLNDKPIEVDFAIY